MNPPDPSKPSPSVPDLELIRCIDAGSFGAVWLAKTVTDRWRAVKVVTHIPGASATLVQRELDGVRHIEELTRSHPNLTQLFRVGLLPGADSPGLYSILELADDTRTGRIVDPASYAPRTLEFDLRSKKCHTIEECAFLLSEIASGLAFLHRHKLVHRDLKPSNIIFVNGRPKLADFGLVGTPHTLTSVVGTPGYFPPEGSGYPQGDVYALGRLALQLIWGRDTPAPPTPPSDTGDWDHYAKRLELHELACRACDPNPSSRPADGTEFLNDLLDTARSLGLSPNFTPAGPPLMSWLRVFDPRNLGVLAVLAISIFFALASTASASQSQDSHALQSWIFSILGIVALFETAHLTVPARRKRAFGRWLENFHPTPPAGPAHATLIRTFENYFSPRHFSWTCLSRTGALSFVTSGLFLIFFYAVEPARFSPGSGYLVTWQSKLSLLAAIWAVTLLPNFLSTFKTRLILRHLAQRPVSRSIAAYLTLDLLLSSLILLATILSASVASTEILKALEVNENVIETGRKFYEIGIYEFSDNLAKFFTNAFLLRDVYGAFVYSTYLTAAWIWLFVGSQTLIQPSASLGASIQAFRAAFDLARNPFRSLQVAALATTLALGVLTAPFYVWKSQTQTGVATIASLNANPALIHPQDSFRLIHIPAHIFHIGTDDPKWPSAYPSTPVELSEFYTAETEVTQAQWERLMGSNPSAIRNPELPVYGISWFEAVMYIYKLNFEMAQFPDKFRQFQGWEFRLPTEAEWESACRAGTTNIFPFPKTQINDFAWTYHNSGGVPQPVRKKRPNAWGIYDMQGNVREWTIDWYRPGYVADELRANQAAPGGVAVPPPRNLKSEAPASRVVRGGSWFSDGSLCRSYARYKKTPDAIRSPNDTQPQTIGLRLVLARKPGHPGTRQNP